MKNVEKRKHGVVLCASVYEIYVGVKTTLANVSCCLPANHPGKMSLGGEKTQHPSCLSSFSSIQRKEPLCC